MNSLPTRIRSARARASRWNSTPEEGEEYLECSGRQVRRFADFDLVLCQAGADVQVDDPPGGVLSTDRMQRRDARVFEVARVAAVPLAWNLADGYQSPVRKVVDLHVPTPREGLKVRYSST